MPEYNARQFTPDGFYRSGDLMRLHPSGNYVVEGRKKDLINRGGEKISAEEIENLILSHPFVQNIACVPIPDPHLGEKMCACVILKKGRALALKELVAFLMDKEIAKFKLPVVSTFHSLISDGLPTRFPELRYGFIEVSSQWVPYAIHDLVRRIERQRGNPRGKIKKNFLAENRFFVTCQTDDDLAYILQYSGEDSLVIGTDYGHSDVSAEIDALKTLRDLPGVTACVADKILSENAKRLYGLR